jgi:hypothetical protein
LIVRTLGENDVVIPDLFFYKALRIGGNLLIADYRTRCWKGGNDIGIAAFEVPEIVQAAVGKNNKTAVLRTGVFASLLFADKRILTFSD